MSEMHPWLAARNLVAVRLDNAGDVVMLGPALRAIKATSPECRITLLASPAGARAAALLPWVDGVLVWRSIWQDLGDLPFDPAREYELIRLLADHSFDGALIFSSFSQTPHVAAYACYLAGIPLRAGESKEFGGGTLSTELRGTPDKTHQVDRNLRLVQALGFTSVDPALEIAIPDDSREELTRRLWDKGISPGQPLVLLHPGASAEARRYPASRFRQVAELLWNQGWRLVLTGSEREREMLEVVAGGHDAIPVFTDLSIQEFAALVARASVVVCGNTLPLHLADATRTPLVALYSGTELISQWGPRFAPARVLQRATACTPCYRFTCPIGLPCLDFDPAEVVTAVTTLVPLTLTRQRNLVSSRRTRDLVVSSHTHLQQRASSHARNDTPCALRSKDWQRAADGEGMTSSVLHHATTPLSREPSRIAVFQALNLGDLLCTTPALRALRARFPAAEISFIGRPWAEDFLARLPAVDRFIPFPGFPGIAESPAGSADTLPRWPSFDLAIQMHGSGEVSNGFVESLGATTSAGFGPAGDRRLTTVLGWVESEPEPLRWLRLAEAVGAPPAGLQTEFPLTPAERGRAAALIGPRDRRPLIGLHAGAADPSRRWPVESFAKLGDRLAERFPARIVLTGSDQERTLTTTVQHLMDAPAIDLAGMTGLGEFAAVTATLDLLVTNDTGASHVAAAMGTPSLVLFGPTRPDRWAPLDRGRHQVIDAASLPGAPADRAAALQTLPVDQVFAACLPILQTPESFRSRFSDQEHVAWAG